MFYLSAGRQAEEVQDYLFVGLEVIQPDSPTGGDGVCAETQKERSVCPAAALHMDQ